MALTPKTLAAAITADPDIMVVERSDPSLELSDGSLADVLRDALDRVQERPDDLIPAELRYVAALLLMPSAPAPLGGYAEQMLEACFVAKPGLKADAWLINMNPTARVLHARDLLYLYLERNKPGA